VVEKIFPENSTSSVLVGEQGPVVRILNVAQTYFPYLAEGGRPVKVRILSRNLAQRGHNVTVLTANLGSEEWTQSVGAPEKTPAGWRMLEHGVEAIYLPSWLRYRALTLNPRVVSFCAASLSKFDLVHFYGLYDLLGPAVSYFCRRQGIPYVIEPMGMYRPIDRSLRLKLLWHRSMGGAFLRNAAQIISTSELEHQELLETGMPPDKLVIRYNGIDASSCTFLPPRGGFRAKWGISPGEPLVLFLSRLIPRKGADILIEAFVQACPESGRLVIAGPEGEPGYRAYLEKCARKSGAEARVIFTGAIYGEEKKAVLADTDVFALPSRYENFANVAAEAMACGIPVIVTDSCGIRSLVEGQAGLVIPPEKEALAGALRKLLDDKVLYARMKEGCRRVADQLRWDRLTEQMEGYYGDALAKGHGAH
jgi:glycosyltransferase involved in cell wall biosynthesis